MKVTYRIPTSEQYAYVEVEEEIMDEGMAAAGEFVAGHYNELTKAVMGGTGLDNKKFIAFLDELWKNHEINGDPGIMEEMSHSQREIVRAIKLCIKRSKT